LGDNSSQGCIALSLAVLQSFGAIFGENFVACSLNLLDWKVSWLQEIAANE
jgi:hypothetical protein